MLPLRVCSVMSLFVLLPLACGDDGEATAPTPPEIARFHAAKREVYRRLRQLEGEARATMAGAAKPG